MLYHDKNDVSEGAHVNKTSASKECLICYHCFFKIEDSGFIQLSWTTVVMHWWYLLILKVLLF